MNQTLTQIQEDFDEKYFDKNTPSGLNQKDFADFPSLVKDIRLNFLTQSNLRVIEKIHEIVERSDNPYIKDSPQYRGYETARSNFYDLLNKQILYIPGKPFKPYIPGGII